MARKRMISPEIWGSNSFSKLSDLAKLIFIGLFSHADDEGYGKANPGYIRSTLFPNDEDRRTADIKNALSEIARKMSVEFYEVDGDSFYYLTNWTIWQKVDKPTKSRIPKPPETGVRGRTTQNQKFGEDSGSVRGGLGEDSSNYRIEENRIEVNLKESEKEKQNAPDGAAPTTFNLFGKFQNVKLTDEEILKLKGELTEQTVLSLIEKLSCYMQSKGKTYKSHYATLLDWHLGDEKQKAEFAQRGKGGSKTFDERDYSGKDLSYLFNYDKKKSKNAVAYDQREYPEGYLNGLFNFDEPEEGK